MAATTTCFTPVRLKVVRVTELDECGDVPEDAEYVVSAGAITLKLAAVVESGDEFIQKNGNGDLCVNERSPDALKRVDVEIEWCNVDPDLVTLITGFPQVVDGEGLVVGFRAQTGTFDTNFAVEGWTGLSGDQCGASGRCYGYMLIPYLTGATFGDITLENGAATFTTKGYTESNAGWGVGPYDVVGTDASPGPLVDAILANQPYHFERTCVTPPTAACGSLPVVASPA